MKKHQVKLSTTDHQWLEAFTRVGSAKAQESTRARILLAADEGESRPALNDQAIAVALGVTVETVERTRKRYAQLGLPASVERRPRKDKGLPTKVDGRVEAQIVALACSSTPNEEPRWTLSMLADRLVKLELVDSISRERVRQTLKKMF